MPTLSKPSSVNFDDGVLKSACNIMRAARFCNLNTRSGFADAVPGHVTDP